MSIDKEMKYIMMTIGCLLIFMAILVFSSLISELTITYDVELSNGEKVHNCNIYGSRGGDYLSCDEGEYQKVTNYKKWKVNE